MNHPRSLCYRSDTWSQRSFICPLLKNLRTLVIKSCLNPCWLKIFKFCLGKFSITLLQLRQIWKHIWNNFRLKISVSLKCLFSGRGWPLRLHLREAPDRSVRVQVRHHVRRLRVQARPQRSLLREQHRHPVRQGPDRGVGRGQEVEVRVVQRLREGGHQAADSSVGPGSRRAQL